MLIMTTCSIPQGHVESQGHWDAAEGAGVLVEVKNGAATEGVAARVEGESVAAERKLGPDIECCPTLVGDAANDGSGVKAAAIC